ncbi:hypothetical protein Acor_15080 [Acrocarpospora corrugata]|uniref:Transferase n=1 Tax=Acrocarpospora corrugata TaxID=35763 RepID=A0A5M3VRP7_9ACTN|nr:class I SAM-dependent methyltransferase [Acrocarpospora corrugata]GER99444.1 hypothetical protein Acor_15080 [Acrocarpospora corrugata]
MLDEPTHIPARVRAAQQAGFPFSCDNRTGSLLRTLVASKPGGRVLELGTGIGVGTAWLLDGMDPTSRLTTIEADPATAARARTVIDEDDRAELVVADAAEWLRNHTGPPFDFAFVDCLIGKFTSRHLVLANLSPGAFYIGDDLLPVPTWPDEHESRVTDFLDAITGEPHVLATLMRWSTGLVVAVYRPAAM